MPDNEKGFFYYFFNILSVLVLIFSLLMNGTLLLVILYRIKNLLKVFSPWIPYNERSLAFVLLPLDLLLYSQPGDHSL